MSFFEAMMIICFGLAWPFSIYKSYRSQKTAGKSLRFLYIVFIGYVAGVIHKYLNSYDWVIYLYALNALMVATDILLFYRNKQLEKRSQT